MIDVILKRCAYDTDSNNKRSANKPFCVDIICINDFESEFPVERKNKKQKLSSEMNFF